MVLAQNSPHQSVIEDNGEYVVIVPKLATENLFLKVENPGYAFQSKFINYLSVFYNTI